MLLTEWNMDKALEVRGREAWEDGVRIGETRGEARGEAKIIEMLRSGKRPEEIFKQYGYM
jgi:hypothetical protein